VLRLRSLALSALGDYAGALAAEREMFRVLAEQGDILLQAMTIQAGPHPDLLRQSLAGYALAALTDPLTGLPNRRHLEQRLAELTAQRRPAVLGMLDLDRFKDVNTVHGHVAGDKVLTRVAEILARTFRREDFVARYGGDEFVALLPDSTLTEAHDLGCRVSAAIAGENWDAIAPGARIGVTIGWTDLTAHLTAQDAVAVADQAMYRAKPTSRN
jgi:diguanylate cyclase (GGDEF)-like protein